MKIHKVMVGHPYTGIIRHIGREVPLVQAFDYPKMHGGILPVGTGKNDIISLENPHRTRKDNVEYQENSYGK
jgi:hypothetical protein